MTFDRGALDGQSWGWPWPPSSLGSAVGGIGGRAIAAGPGQRLQGAGAVALDEVRRRLQRLLDDDDGRDQRQVIVDLDGVTATFTGSGCLDWAAADRGRVAIQGNISSPEVVAAMRRAGTPELPTHHWPSCWRPAGRRQAGGDRRGRESAALLVVRESARMGGFDDVRSTLDDHIY
jgi:uncharacterized Ntn-hydrolase superfamily protein